MPFCCWLLDYWHWQFRGTSRGIVFATFLFILKKIGQNLRPSSIGSTIDCRKKVKDLPPFVILAKLS
jgi:hypothetical protein